MKMDNELPPPSCLSFEEWVESIFRHPVAEPSWWWNENEIRPLDPEIAPNLAIDFLIRLFETGTELDPYSNDQVAQGLWFLLDSSCSNYMELLRNSSIPLPSRLRCLAAIVKLNREVFARRCRPIIEGIDEEYLETTCYMLWDLSEALTPHSGDADMDEACLDTLIEVLEIPHHLCQKSALHGLGHWSDTYSRVSVAIDEFLQRSDVPRELRQYAVEASAGRVP
jgi:hypothetical protein